MSVENPFLYGDVATGTSFTNRKDELAVLTADILSGQNVVVISPRRYGKTSLVLQAAERLREQRVLVAYLDLFRTPTPHQFASHLATAIYDGLVAPVDRALQRAAEFFQQLPLRPKMTVNQDATPSFEFTGAPADHDVTATVERLLSLPGRVAKERKRRVAIVFDEFQEVLTIDEHLPAIMRAIFQTQPEVAHVFLGSKRHLMERVFTDQNQPLYRSAKPLPLEPIARDDFATFIRDRFTETSVSIEDSAIDLVLDTTGGHPHDTQELCYFTWQRAQREGGPVTQETVSAALDDVLHAEDARCTVIWDNLSPHQRLVLTALSLQPGMVYGEDYRREHGLGAPSSVSRSVERLLERELLEYSPVSGYRVPDVFLREWVRKTSRPHRLNP